MKQPCILEQPHIMEQPCIMEQPRTVTNHCILRNNRVPYTTMTNHRVPHIVRCDKPPRFMNPTRSVYWELSTFVGLNSCVLKILCTENFPPLVDLNSRVPYFVVLSFCRFVVLSLFCLFVSSLCFALLICLLH